MRISRKLNLVVPIYEDPDPKEPDKEMPLRAVVHSVPIAPETFDAYFEPIGQVFTEIHSRGFGSIAGPKIADKILRKIAMASGNWESNPKVKGHVGVKEGLVAEIHRLTNVLAPTERGWRDLMYQEAKEDGVLTADDAQEVDAALIFFTVASCMYPHRDLKAILDGAMNLWGARVEYSSLTELKTSSPTWMQAGNSGEPAPAS